MLGGQPEDALLDELAVDKAPWGVLAARVLLDRAPGDQIVDKALHDGRLGDILGNAHLVVERPLPRVGEGLVGLRDLRALDVGVLALVALVLIRVPFHHLFVIRLFKLHVGGVRADLEQAVVAALLELLELSLGGIHRLGLRLDRGQAGGKLLLLGFDGEGNEGARGGGALEVLAAARLVVLVVMNAAEHGPDVFFLVEAVVLVVAVVSAGGDGLGLAVVRGLLAARAARGAQELARLLAARFVEAAGLGGAGRLALELVPVV
mmetsp:Transcript_23488/g.74888  ORF Transcript_23488/g.74888 Transcript_23488/m.74888 type:complete len:263 (-) Transcript_23488:720-1508(-)